MILWSFVLLESFRPISSRSKSFVVSESLCLEKARENKIIDIMKALWYYNWAAKNGGWTKIQATTYQQSIGVNKQIDKNLDSVVRYLSCHLDSAALWKLNNGK